MRRLILLLPIAWLAVACLRDPFLPEHNVDGVWKTFSAPRLVAVGDSLLVCRLGTATIEFAQSGTTLGGRTAGIVFGCGAGETTSISLSIVNGWVRGDSLGFDFGTENTRSVGTFRGDTMSGITTVRVLLATREVYLTGPFTAVR